jgi:hypothetical protein
MWKPIHVVQVHLPGHQKFCGLGSLSSKSFDCIFLIVFIILEKDSIECQWSNCIVMYLNKRIVLVLDDILH